jgi:hypothetical protein
MLVANSQLSTFHSSQQQQEPAQDSYYYYPSAADIDIDIDIDIDADASSHSLSSSPQSTQSLFSQYSALQAARLAAFDGIPTIAVPRGADLFGLSAASSASLDDPSSVLPPAGLMQPDSSWLANNAQLGPKTAGSQISHHHRASSLSSLGSAGPASPFSQNTSNPHIAVTDSLGDGYHGLPFYEDSSYQLAKPLGSTSHDAFYASQGGFGRDATATTAAGAYSTLLTPHKPRSDRGLLPPPELLAGSNRSRPVSVASSVASDSPATPLLEHPEDERRRRSVFGAIPKLDRTMTDIYSDELYSPNFTLTSATPSQSSSQLPLSPSHDMFAQRLQAISTQHLSAAHPPALTVSRDNSSPFRHGSPLAPAMSSPHDFVMGPGPGQIGFGPCKAEQDAQVLRQQMARNSGSGTSQTISPKDALLEYHDGEPEMAHFPLFPPQNHGSFDADQMSKTATGVGQAYDGAAMDGTGFNYLASQLPSGIRVPQQYPFIADVRQKSTSSTTSASLGVPSRVSSAGGGSSDSGRSDGYRAKPSGSGADSGTYSCTYHGCAQRFETPVLLQKHKREGHRQAHGLGGPRRVEGAGPTTSSLLNSQAGPHRCDRINPTTGKPCGTVFSRPYDLTRHEDTIHNARKQKVRCGLCTEEKTFSRADALTRHFRVCHPDVELSGKHRRRAAHGG